MIGAESDQPLDRRMSVLVERLALYLSHGRNGTNLPDSVELAHRFDVSAEEMLAALEELRRRHIIRASGNGMLRRSEPVAGQVPMPPGARAVRLSDPGGAALRLQTRALWGRVPPAPVAGVLGLADGDPAAYLTRMVLADGDPATRSQVWIHPGFAGPLNGASGGKSVVEIGQLFGPDALDEYLDQLFTAQGCRPVLTELQIDIGAAGPQIARQLRLRGRPPTPRIVTVHSAGDTAVAHTTTWVHPDYFHLTVTGTGG